MYTESRCRQQAKYHPGAEWYGKIRGANTGRKLATAVHYGEGSHNVQLWQEFFFDRRYSCSEMDNPDFAKVAEAYGAVGIRVTSPPDIRPALEHAMSVKKPVVMDFITDPEENVLPMVPPGEAISKMLG